MINGLAGRRLEERRPLLFISDYAIMSTSVMYCQQALMSEVRRYGPMSERALYIWHVVSSVFTGLISAYLTILYYT